MRKFIKMEVAVGFKALVNLLAVLLLFFSELILELVSVSSGEKL